MDQREARLGQHRFGQSGNAAHDVDADARRAAKRGQVIDHGGDGGRRVVQLPVEMNHPIGIDGSDPVNFLGDIDADADAHSPLRALIKARPAPPTPSSPYTAINRRA